MKYKKLILILLVGIYMFNFASAVRWQRADVAISSGNSTFNQSLTDIIYYSILNPSNFLNSTFNQTYNNYVLANQSNNSLYWQGHTGTDGSWLTGISTFNITYQNKAGTGNCPAGQVVMNTTNSGVQCVAVTSNPSGWMPNNASENRNYTTTGTITGNVVNSTTTIGAGGIITSTRNTFTGFVAENTGGRATALQAGVLFSNFLFDDAGNFAIQAVPRADVLADVGGGGIYVLQASAAGVLRFNQYTTDGFVKFINTDGTIEVDTTTYDNFWQRVSTTISPRTAGDNITTTGTGTFKSINAQATNGQTGDLIQATSYSGTLGNLFKVDINGSVRANGTAWFGGNVSATGYITRTSVYDKSKGDALSYIKDASSYLDTKGNIDHSAFYGYVTYPVTDYSKPETKEECHPNVDMNGTLINDKQICQNVTTYPYTKQEEGVDLGKEIDVLRQSLFEIKDCTAKSSDWISYQKCIGELG